EPPPAAMSLRVAIRSSSCSMTLTVFQLLAPSAARQVASAAPRSTPRNPALSARRLCQLDHAAPLSLRRRDGRSRLASGRSLRSHRSNASPSPHCVGPLGLGPPAPRSSVENRDLHLRGVPRLVSRWRVPQRIGEVGIAHRYRRPTAQAPDGEGNHAPAHAGESEQVGQVRPRPALAQPRHDPPVAVDPVHPPPPPP